MLKIYLIDSYSMCRLSKMPKSARSPFPPYMYLLYFYFCITRILYRKTFNIKITIITMKMQYLPLVLHTFVCVDNLVFTYKCWTALRSCTLYNVHFLLTYLKNKCKLLSLFHEQQNRRSRNLNKAEDI